MTFIDYIEPSIIKIPLEAKSKEGVLRELVQLLVDAGKIEDFDAPYQALLEREQKGSTGLEAGIAVPHAKTESVPDLTVAIGIAPEGIDFQAMDGNPSTIFFLLLAPPGQSGPHIEALSEIAKITRSKGFCKMLLKADDAEEVAELFLEDE